MAWQVREKAEYPLIQHARTYAELYAESAFFPLVIYYQTQFYRRGELARRLAIFYAASNIAGAFGGLLAYGVFHISGGALPNW